MYKPFWSFVFGVVFSLHGTLSAQAERVDRVLAIVNKSPIFLSDVNKFKSTLALRQKVDPFYGPSLLARKSSPSLQEYVDYLIGEELVVQKFPVQDADVEQEINSIQGNLKIDRASLKQAIQTEGFKFEEYFKLMRTSIAKRQLLDREIRSKAAVSDDEVKNLINQNKFSQASFHGSFHLFLIRTQAEAKAKAAYSEILAGSSFETAAKKYSEISAEEGGDLGYLSYSDLSPFLQKNVRALKVGQMSNVLRDGKTFLILKVTDIKSDEDSSGSPEKEAIRAQLMEKEFQHQIELWVERQKAANYIRINSL